jgi:hypothetical protein
VTDDLNTLRAELDAIRNELAEVQVEQQRAITRRRLLSGLAGLGAAGAAGVANAPAAGAADGEPVLLGESNVATTATFISVTEGTDPSEVALNAGPWGIHATASGVGVLGTVDFGGVAGVFGHVDGPIGAGVTGEADDPGAMGVTALSKAGPAIGASSVLDGVTLELQPADRTGPPVTMPSGLVEYRRGAVSVDAQGEMWLCVGTGAPGTWTRLLREDTAPGRVIAMAPMRALDTRSVGGRPSGSPAIPGQKQGPLKGGEAITLDLAGVTPIPATASGVVGNLTVVSPTYNGYLVAGPAGTTPTTSALNFTKGTIVANAFTSQINTTGLTLRASGTTANTYHLVVDITACIT